MRAEYDFARLKGRRNPYAKALKKRSEPRFREMVEFEKEKAKIASLIVKYRADHRISQGQLAKKVGVAEQDVSKIEEGDFSNLAVVWRILGTLGYRISFRVFQRAA